MHKHQFREVPGTNGALLRCSCKKTRTVKSPVRELELTGPARRAMRTAIKSARG